MGEKQAQEVLDALVEGDTRTQREHPHHPGLQRGVEVDMLVRACSRLIVGLCKKNSTIRRHACT